ncbi:MAG: hypothetical protein ACRDBG_04460 [Waterburya sp.]
MQLQQEINNNRGDMSPVILIDSAEESFIRNCIENKVFPNGWNGTEATSDEWIEEYFPDGSKQLLLGF